MFTILELKVFGEEYEIVGDANKIKLKWRESPKHPWDYLYSKKLDDDGIECCLEELGDELRVIARERKNEILSAYRKCLKVGNEG